MELKIAIGKLALQDKERELRAAELVVANTELAFQNAEKAKRADELVTANLELIFQNDEKEKRAEELLIANKELIFQHGEKEKRANELIIANKELAFQHAEKAKRADELIIANRELIFQHAEKEKRANELALANKELIFQNAEKEKRAAELIIANVELARQNIERESRASELMTANEVLATRTAELVTANKELESFSYSVSHDMRAPLRAIQGYARMLKEDYEGQLDSEANRRINRIVDNAKRMGQLIDELLEFSRLGRKEMLLVNVPMQSMVENLCKEIPNEYPGCECKFTILDLLPVKGDSTGLKQTWVNLISNAVKYSGRKEKPTVEIGCLEKANEIVYYIKDNGAGFDMRFYNKLFGVFQRLHSEEQFEGTGVGLAIVHRIITKHGGTVWAESKVNEGATFYFSIPHNL
jgi:signal transduction histidine kinase